MLLASNASVNHSDDAGETALQWASNSNIPKVVALLIGASADVGMLDRAGQSALIKAAIKGNTEVATHLIAARADPCHADSTSSKTALHYAVEHGHREFIDLMVSATFPSLRGAPLPVRQLIAGVGAAPENLAGVGAWIATVMPHAATKMETKRVILTLISHMYVLSKEHPTAADHFFNHALRPAAQAEQDRMPALLHLLATELGADTAVAPTSLQNGGLVHQGQYLAFMRPERGAALADIFAGYLYTHFRAEAIAAEADIADPVVGPFRGNNAGFSTQYKSAHVHPDPTLPEIMVAMLCLVSEFLFVYLQRNRPDLMAGQHDTSLVRGLIKWPGPKTMLRMIAKMTDDYAAHTAPWTALLDTVRFSLVSRTRSNHVAFVKPFSSDSNVGGMPTDPELVAVRAKSTLEDPTAAVKQELWNLVYSPAGLTFGSMVGGLDEVTVNRWEEYGDVLWGDGWENGNPNAARLNRVTAVRPRNPAFIAALSSAKHTNPEVSPYVWEAALKLLAHPTFELEQVQMIIEVQLYLEEFLAFRKTVHCYYKITRAPNLSSLAQDCRKYAVNPAEAYDRQRELDYDAAAAAAAVAARATHKNAAAPTMHLDAEVRLNRLEGELADLDNELGQVQRRLVALHKRCNDFDHV